MMRWIIALCVIALAAASLVGTRDYNPAAQGPIADELLAYEVTPPQAVTVDVPAATPTVQMTTWALLDPVGEFAPLDAIAYGLEVETWSRATDERKVRRYGVLSRIAKGSRGEQLIPGFVARLADGAEWATDPRTLDVDTSLCMAEGGRLKVRALPADYQHLLVRLSYREGRGEIERDLYERSLTQEQVQRILNRTTALGFVDLSEDARAYALSFWGRRLSAIGRSAKDYHMRRLLVGELAGSKDHAELRSLEFKLGNGRRAAFNFTRPLVLRVHGEPGVRVWVRSGDLAAAGGLLPNSDQRERPVEGVISREGYVDLRLQRGGLRTVTLEADTVSLLSFSVAESYADAQVGEVDHITFPDGRVQISPDVRVRAHYQLDPEQPVVLHVAQGQGPFRLRIRGSLPADTDLSDPKTAPATIQGRLRAQWLDADGRVRRQVLRVALAPSVFEDFGDQGGATEESVAYLFPPAGAKEIKLLGDAHLAFTAQVGEPGVERAVIHPAYRVAASPHQRFVHAPYDIGRWTAVVPEEAQALRLGGRVWSLRAQVRWVVGAADEREPPERGITPLGHPVRRKLWVHRAVAADPGGPLEWFEIRHRQVLRIADRGTAEHRLRLRYHAGASRLGSSLSVAVDGQQRYAAPLVVTSGELSLAVQPGLREVAVEGLGEEGVVYVDAPPRVPMEALREYAVYEIARGGRLSFPIVRKGDQPLRLMVFVVTDGTRVPWTLRYAIEGGRQVRRASVFFREPTELAGELAGISGELEEGLLWQGRSLGPRRASLGRDGVSKARINLGDDLTARELAVTLSLPPIAKTSTGAAVANAQRVWVRAVLVGQAMREREQPGRQWTKDVDDAL